VNDLLSAPPERDLPPARRASIRAELLRAVSLDAAGPTTADRVGRFHRPARRRRVRLFSLAAAVLVAIALLAVPVILPSGSIDPAAASLLHRFSSLALKIPTEPAPEAGQYVYERTRSRALYELSSTALGASFRYYELSFEERWLGVDGSGRSDWEIGQPAFLTEADRELYEHYVASGLMAQDGWRFEWGRSGSKDWAPGELTFFDFSDLPTDVEQLKGMIERREIIGGPEGDWETFNLSADILTWSYAPPTLRAALFEVMANLPGISSLGPTDDTFGRPGIVIGYTHEGLRQEVVFDRGTGQVLERREVSLTDDLDGGSCSGPPGACEGTSQTWIAGPSETLSSVVTYRVYGAVVDAIGDVPDADSPTT
jgi:hypothetical protein